MPTIQDYARFATNAYVDPNADPDEVDAQLLAPSAPEEWDPVQNINYSPHDSDFYATAYQNGDEVIISKRSPHGARRNAGFRLAMPIPDFASLHPGYLLCRTTLA